MRFSRLVVLLSVFLVAGVGLFAIIQNTSSIKAESPYTVLMLICGGTYDSTNLHMSEFATEDEAKAWADNEMNQQWDIAYIYHGREADNDTKKMILARSDSSCYPGMTTWTRF